jgi:phosphoglycerol transferase MdoB-like AlkP superfamily enzyme
MKWRENSIFVYYLNYYSIGDMKRRLLLLIKTFFLFALLFVVLKPIFMLYNHAVYQSVPIADYFRVIWHGLSLDLSVAGYYTVIPGLLLIASVFCRYSVIQLLQKIYFIAISILLSLIYIIDMVLYGYWGFRLDSTPFYYFLSSPKDALASVSIWVILFGIIIIGILAFLLYLLFDKILIRLHNPMEFPSRRLAVSGGLLLCTAMLFIFIRGGFSVAVMNISRVYFSTNQRLNHAAINPCFSFFNSFVHEADFKNQYRYFKSDEANRIFAKLVDKTDGDANETKILNTSRPNVIVIVLESFSCKLMATMGGLPNVAVNMDKLGQEGVLFTHFFANSFRTDRGLAAILAAYPAQPTTSIMKYPSKSETLPMFPKVLRQAGYNLKFYYGGDINFANEDSFLKSAGFDEVVSIDDFPLSQRFTKWGAPDKMVFDHMISDLTTKSVKQPFLKILQTSSSHEPFDVPFYRLKDKRLNAFAYADNCLGNFIHRLKATPIWKNTLIILVPDHLGAYPPHINDYSFSRYHIPLIFIGGAVKGPMKVSTYGSQIDIAATLLSQLGLSHKAFTFSKDMFNSKSPHFGYSTFPNAFCMITPEDSLFFDCEANRVLIDRGPHKLLNLKLGKTYLQKLFDDLSRR